MLAMRGCRLSGRFEHVFSGRARERFSDNRPIEPADRVAPARAGVLAELAAECPKAEELQS